jgi:hypothetical protein
VRVQDKPLRLVPRSQERHGIVGHLRRTRNLGQRPAVRAAEPKLAIRLSIKPVALLVDRAVVPATEHGEIRERSGAPLCPVTDVMALAESDPTAREAAAAVAVVERPP